MIQSAMRDMSWRDAIADTRSTRRYGAMIDTPLPLYVLMLSRRRRHADVFAAYDYSLMLAAYCRAISRHAAAMPERAADVDA